MATRFYLPETQTAPVSVTPDAAWEVTSSPAVLRRMTPIKKTQSDALTTTGSFTSTTGQDRLHRQYVSDPMAAGITFDTGVTYKCYVQVLESNADDNIVSRLGVRIVSQDGTVVRHTPLTVADYSTGTEWNTTIRNKAFANGDAGAGSYVTVAGDRLVVEIGHNDSSGASISGSSRFGTVSAGGDSGEDETGTGSTLAPWFETSATVTFLEMSEGFEISPDGTGLTPGNTSLTTVSNTSIMVSDSGLLTTYGGSFSGLIPASATTCQGRFEFPAISEMWLRVYFQMDTLPAASNSILIVRSGASVVADSQIGTGGALRLRNQASTLIDTSSVNLAVDTWHRIEWHLTATRWEARVFASGNVDSTTADEDETTLGGTTTAASWDNFVIGVGTSATWTISLEDLKMRTDTWVGSSAPASTSRSFSVVVGA